MVALPYKSTVSSASASKDMTVLATVKTELGLTSSEHDGFLSTAIQQASAAIVSYCRREFAKETLVDRFRVAECTDTIQLSRRPIATVSSIVENDVTLASTDYEIIADVGQVIRLDANEVPIAWDTCGAVVVTYAAGWVMLTELPQDLEQVCIDLVKSKYYARRRDPNIRAEEVNGVARFEYWVDTGQYVRGLPAGIAQRLDELGYVDAAI